MPSQDILRIIVPILERHEVSHASLFGSYARGAATTNSDIFLERILESSQIIQLERIVDAPEEEV